VFSSTVCSHIAKAVNFAAMRKALLKPTCTFGECTVSTFMRMGAKSHINILLKSDKNIDEQWHTDGLPLVEWSVKCNVYKISMCLSISDVHLWHLSSLCVCVHMCVCAHTCVCVLVCKCLQF